MRFELTERVAAGVDRVFAIAADVDAFPQNIPGILRTERLTPGPVGVGTRFKETRKLFGREATEELSVAVWDPPHVCRIDADSCGGGNCIQSMFRFVPVDGGTEIKLEVSMTATSWFAKLMQPLARMMMMGPMKKLLQEDLRAVKTAAEKPA